MHRLGKFPSCIRFIILFCFILVIGYGSYLIFKDKVSPQNNSPTLVNLQVTEYKNPDALIKVINEFEIREINKATIFVGGEFATVNCPLIKEYDREGFEIALFGYSLDKEGNFIQLATLPKTQQQEIITKAKANLENCLGHKVSGFRSQRFSQNDDTNQIVKDLGFTWNGSFVSGSSYLPEAKDTFLPYKSSSYGFYVVSMIGAEVNPGTKTALCDAALNNVVDSPDQWSETVETYYQRQRQNSLPLLTEFHPYFLVERPDWWSNFISLLNWLKNQNSNFVTTQELIDHCLPSVCTE